MAVLFCGACLHLRLAEHELPPMERLQEGDLILMFSPTLPSGVLARLARAPGNDLPALFSHAEILVRSEKGNWYMVGIRGPGLQKVPVRRAVGELSHMAAFRARESDPERRRQAAQYAYRWASGPEAAKIGFDAAARDVPGRRTKFYCAGFINEVCRANDLPVPFSAPEGPVTAVAESLARMTGAEGQRSAAIASIFANPDYELVVSWRHPRLSDPDRLRIVRVASEAVYRFAQEQWMPKGVEVPEDAASLTDKQRLRQLYRARRRLFLFSADVRRMWDRLERRGRTDAMHEGAKEDLLRRICQEYREKHFYKTTRAGGGPSGGDRLPRAAVSDAAD